MTNLSASGIHEEKIPIVYVLDNFYRGGGTENQLYALIENLDRTRFTPYVFNLRPKWPDKSVDINCDVYYLDVESPLSIAALKAIFKIAKFIKARNVQILQVYFIDSRIIATLAGRLARVKRIVFCRRDGGYWHHRKKLLFLIRQFAKLAHYGLVNAGAMKKIVTQAERFPANKIEVIYNGVELKPVPNAPTVAKSDFNIPDDAPVIGHVANYRQIKRIDRLIEAASMMHNKKVHFLLIGTGPELEKLQSMAEEHGLADRVHFHFVEGVYNVLKIIDIGVLASRSEALSNVLIEYALAGLPAVAFDVGGNSEIISDGETGYIIKDGDVKQLAEKLDYLLDNPESAKKLGGRAVEIAVEKFDVKNMVTKTENFYINILKTRTQSRPFWRRIQMKKTVKTLFYIFCYLLVLPCGLTAKICYRFLRWNMPYHFFAETFSLVPSPIGYIIRGCYYNQTLKSTYSDLFIHFGSHISKVDCVIGRNVKIGGHTIIGLANIGDNAIIANNINVLSGRRQHNFEDPTRELLAGSDTFDCINIGEGVFVGDNSIIMANIGDYSIIGAGSVVVKDIPAYSVAVGNPARVIKERPRQTSPQVKNE